MVRESLGKPKKLPIFLNEYCTFHGYPLRDACSFFGVVMMKEAS
jgi:hypothetical protein